VQGVSHSAAQALPRRLITHWTSLADATLLLVAGVVILIPTWLVLPPDDEDLFKEIAATVYQSNEVFSGHYALWSPLVGFGVPLPFTQTLIFHPFALLVQIFSVGNAIAVFYQLHLWIGMLSMWALARTLGAGRVGAAAGALTYALASPTIYYLEEFWPVIFVQWTLAPLLLLLLIWLFDADRTSTRVTLMVAAGLCAGLFVVDGHSGLLPDFGLGFLAFLIGGWSRVRAAWPWLFGVLGIGGLIASSRWYDIALETVRSHEPRGQESASMDAPQLFFYPIHAPGSNDGGLIAIGGVFFLLAAFAIFYPGVKGRYANALRAGAVVSFVAFFVPGSWLFIRSANYFVADPFAIFAILLALMALRTLWGRFPRVRPALALALAVQFAAMIGGYEPYFSSNLSRANDYRAGEPVPSLRAVLKNQPVYEFLQRQPDHARTRAYFAPGAEDRIFRELSDYEFAVWPLHDLRLVNGIFKGIGLDELGPQKKKLKGEIHADPRLVGSPLTLDVLGIGYVLATPEDKVAPGLRRLTTIQLDHPFAEIEIYRNPGRWPDAVLLRRAARNLGPLPRRPGCDDPGILCSDFRPVARMLEDAHVRTSAWEGTTLRTTFRRADLPTTLLLSQIYRPGWRAKLPSGDTVGGHKIVGGFTGFDLPAGTSAATISFHPTSRIALTILTWATIFLAVLFLIGATAGRWAFGALRRARATHDVGGQGER
jgi:hypothetical protein